MYLNDITYSPNGKLLASGGHDGTVRLWNTADHGPVMTLRGHAGPVDAVQFSPDGKTLASSGVDDFTVRLWDVSAFGGANPR
jgi:WD40 repeat protein